MTDQLFRTLDGGLVTIASGTIPAVSSSTTSLVAAAGSKTHEFESGGREFGDQVAEWLAIKLDEEYGLQGGMLRLGQRMDGPRDTHLGIWYGDSYVVKLACQYVDHRLFRQVWEDITIEETEHGIVIGVADRAAHPIRLPLPEDPPLLALPISPVELLEARPLTPHVRGELPGWHGARVENGEMYVEEGETARQTTYLWEGRSAVVRLYPGPDVATHEGAVDALSRLSLEWEY